MGGLSHYATLQLPTSIIAIFSFETQEKEVIFCKFIALLFFHWK